MRNLKIYTFSDGQYKKF
jgi:hypothetical protein